MIPPSIKERLLRLQRENKRLNVALSGGGSSALLGRDSGNIQVLQSMIDTMKERSNELEDANRKANQKILELESKLEDHLASTNVAVPRIPGSKEELELKLSESKKKVASLQETMQKKDMEIQGMEERYKRYIEKAKSVIKTFEPKQGGVAGGSGGSVGGPELVMLRSQINDKDRIIENIEQENEKARAVREMEDRLITSAFYNLSMQMHRNAVESRLVFSLGQANTLLMGSVGDGRDEPWWVEVQAFCVRVSLEAWIVLLRNQFDLHWAEEPHWTRTMLYQPHTGRYLTRVWGQTHRQGVLSSPEGLAPLARRFFLQQEVCLGLSWSGVAPAGHDPENPEKVAIPRSLRFSPNCTRMVDDGPRPPKLGSHTPQCPACAVWVDPPPLDRPELPMEAAIESVAPDFKPELSEDDTIPVLFQTAGPEDREEEAQDEAGRAEAAGSAILDTLNESEHDEPAPGGRRASRRRVQIRSRRVPCQSKRAKLGPDHHFAEQSEWGEGKEKQENDVEEEEDEEEEEIGERPEQKAASDLICPVCRKEFLKSVSLRRHLREFHLKANFICMQCNPAQKAFDYPEEAFGHYQACHSALRLSQFQIKCPNCRDVIDLGGQPDALVVHCRACLKAKQRQQRQQRSLNRPQPSSKTEFVCDECGKRFASAQCLRFHIKVHTGEGIIACPECPYQTPDPSRMKVHRKIHLRQQGLLSKVVCDWCGLALRDNCSLKLHIATQHDASRPMSSTCSYCQKTFTTKRTLSLHIARKHETSEKFKCEECGKGFSAASLLRFHTKNNHRAPAFKCGFCGKMMTSKVSLQCHERIHTGENPYRCQLCDYSCKSSATLSLHRKFIHNQGKNLTEHPIDQSSATSLNQSDVMSIRRRRKSRSSERPIQSHTDSTTAHSLANSAIQNPTAGPAGSKTVGLVCPICQKEYGFLNSFRDHMRLVHLKGQFKCTHCDPVTILAFPSQVVHHYQSAHPSLPTHAFRIQCPNCKDVVDFSEDLPSLAVHYQHCVKASKKRAGLRYQQKLRSNQAQGTKPAFVCDECGKKYASARSLDYHIKLHRGQDLIACPRPQCSYETPNPHVMKLHSKKHLREEGLLAKVVCDLCGLELRDNGSLKLHMATQHDSAKPLSSTCGHCHKTFATKTVMLRHIHRMHDTSEAFKCDKCGKGFSTSVLLLEHAQRNHRPPAFKCSFCAKMLSSKDSLKCHERLHTGENPFRCQLCDYTCKSSSSLSLHRKFVHKEGRNLLATYDMGTTKRGRPPNPQAPQPSGLSENEQVDPGRQLAKPVQVYPKNLNNKRDADGKYKCEYCDHRVTTLSGKLTHKKLYHGWGRFACDSCPSVFKEALVFCRHIMDTHVGVSEGTCPQCQQRINFDVDEQVFEGHYMACVRSNRMAQYAKLVAAQRLKTPETVQCTCDTCGRTFNSLQRLKIHRRIHEGKGSLCKECGFWASHPSVLKCHMQKHEREKGLVSELICPHCARVCLGPGQYKTHLESRHQPFQCSQCPEVFLGKRLLNIHSSAIHGANRCDTCAMCFTSIGILRRHRLTHSEPSFQCRFCPKMFKAERCL
ncbi:hypothetical protein TCAL_13451, partial [Tigriopus californicus]